MVPFVVLVARAQGGLGGSRNVTGESGIPSERGGADEVGLAQSAQGLIRATFDYLILVQGRASCGVLYLEWRWYWLRETLALAHDSHR